MPPVIRPVLNVPIHSPNDLEAIARDFILDGFACVKDTLTADELAYAQEGANRIVAEQTARIALEDGNRGFARYSFGSQIEHPEWRQYIDLPSILSIVEHIWGTDDFQCSGVGGDYSLPGAKIQHLHADIRDPLNDPLDDVTIFDLPAPRIVVNFTMTDFTEENGPTRIVRGTHRSRHPIPSLAEEPDWMKAAILVAPAGTAIVRDIRAWHGGTENRSRAPRVMTGVGYTAPWFRHTISLNSLSHDIYQTMSERSRQLCRSIVTLPQ